MSFRFRLQSLAELRRVERDGRRAELRRAEDQLQMLERQQQTLRAELQAARDQERKAGEHGALRSDELLRWHEYARRLRGQLRQLQDRLLAATADVERCRRMLLDADRSVKTLEKLHDRQRQQYEQELRGREIRELDEAPRPEPDLHGGWA